MGSPVVSPLLVDLAVRVLTFIFLMASLIVLATDTIDDGVDAFGNPAKIKFNDFYAYRYMVSVTVIGMAYTLLQIAFTTFHFCTGKPLRDHHSFALIHLYTDKVVSYFLSTGAAAGFGLTVDSNRGQSGSVKHFLNKANAAASLLLFGFFFSAVSSVFSSYNLPRNV